MPSYKYLVAGAGMTADAAVKGIREIDAEGPIALVGSEPHRPYKRPPLTKDLWKNGDESKIWRSELDVDLRTKRRITAIDPAGGATDDAGEDYSWEKLILATGDGRSGDRVLVREAAARDRRHATAAKARRQPRR